MRKTDISTIVRIAVVTAFIVGSTGSVATATEPCFDFGECKVLIEINASDGDIGFHFLMDGDDLIGATIRDPEGQVIFRDRAFGPLQEQFLTETFAESAEPLCWEDPEADEEDLEDVVSLEDFLDIWSSGFYLFSGKGEDGERSHGQTELTYALPAAPADLAFDGSVISWSAGDDLGNCASFGDLAAMVPDVLPIHPVDVEVAAWEIVLEPDVEDGDPTGALKFTIRVAGDIGVKEVTVPADYLASLPDDTPVKLEVGAIGHDDNATFWEIDGICVNEDEGCEEED
jgi:hypothetical protein